MPCIGNVEPLILVQNGLYHFIYIIQHNGWVQSLQNLFLCLPLHFIFFKSQRYYTLYILICQFYLVAHVFIFNNRGQFCVLVSESFGGLVLLFCALLVLTTTLCGCSVSSSESSTEEFSFGGLFTVASSFMAEILCPSDTRVSSQNVRNPQALNSVLTLAILNK